MGLLPRLLEIACIDLHQTRSVGEDSDHLQLTKFWPSCAPGRGSAAGLNFFGSALLQPAQCLRLSERFFSVRIKFANPLYSAEFASSSNSSIPTVIVAFGVVN